MTRKSVLFVALFLMIAVTLIAADMAMFKAGNTTVTVYYERGNTSRSVFDRISRQGTLSDAKPSRLQMEYVREALNYFVTTRGDVYTVNISNMRDLMDGYLYVCICEFTSNSNFNYWFYSYHGK
jgi:hypothetical protein